MDVKIFGEEDNFLVFEVVLDFFQAFAINWGLPVLFLSVLASQVKVPESAKPTVFTPNQGPTGPKLILLYNRMGTKLTLADYDDKDSLPDTMVFVPLRNTGHQSSFGSFCNSL